MADRQSQCFSKRSSSKAQNWRLIFPPNRFSPCCGPESMAKVRFWLLLHYDLVIALFARLLSKTIGRLWNLPFSRFTAWWLSTWPIYRRRWFPVQFWGVLLRVCPSLFLRCVMRYRGKRWCFRRRASWSRTWLRIWAKCRWCLKYRWGSVSILSSGRGAWSLQLKDWGRIGRVIPLLKCTPRRPLWIHLIRACW